MIPTDRELETIVREEWSKVVATVMRHFGDLQLAEDATQDALTEALETWKRTGIPDRPGAWLTTVARRRAIDRSRRERVRSEKEALEANLDRPARNPGATAEDDERWSNDDMEQLADDQLRLVFTCCHPALALDAQIALTLRAVGGLTTPEIARAFLVPESTMAQRLVRAKKKIKVAGIPFVLPDEEVIADRLQAVLTTVYLIFNEGYASRDTTDDSSFIRHELCDEAIRLGRTLHVLLPDEGEVTGLLALMLFTDSRRRARLGPDGQLVLLADQDRALWNRSMIDQGDALLDGSRIRPISGPYRIQAEIARCHADAPTVAETDWRVVADLYTRLAALTGSSVVELNRAVAVAMADGPASGLAVLDRLVEQGQLEDYHLLHAARADLLRRMDRADDARQAYEQALALAPSEPERSFLAGRLADLDAPPG